MSDRIYLLMMARIQRKIAEKFLQHFQQEKEQFPDKYTTSVYANLISRAEELLINVKEREQRLADTQETPQ
jgi:hypothetical protein